MLKIYENSLHQVPLDANILEQSTLTIKLIATYKSGQTSELPEIQYKRKWNTQKVTDDFSVSHQN